MSFLQTHKDTYEKYWTMAEAVVGQTARCQDEECDGYAELEQDGDHRYMECQECGFSWGYERTQEQSMEGTCAIGVPETVRKIASGEPVDGAGSLGGPVTMGTPVQLSRKPV